MALTESQKEEIERLKSKIEKKKKEIAEAVKSRNTHNETISRQIVSSKSASSKKSWQEDKIRNTKRFNVVIESRKDDIEGLKAAIDKIKKKSNAKGFLSW